MMDVLRGIYPETVQHKRIRASALRRLYAWLDCAESATPFLSNISAAALHDIASCIPPRIDDRTSSRALEKLVDAAQGRLADYKTISELSAFSPLLELAVNEALCPCDE